MRPRGGAGWIVAAALVLVACTTPERTVTSRPPVTQGGSSSAPASAVEPSPLPEPPASAADLPGELLVRTVVGGLDVYQPGRCARPGDRARASPGRSRS